MRYDSLYTTIKNSKIFEIFFDNKNDYYLLFVENKFVKKYKNKDRLYAYIYNKYNVSLIF
jgi:hypothetical protein